MFPSPQDSNNSVLVTAWKERDFGDIAGFLAEAPSVDTIKLIATAIPLDVGLFEQTAYKTRGAGTANENPLERFLIRSMGNSGIIQTGKPSNSSVGNSSKGDEYG